jgi:hypothetical protein
MRHHLMLRRGEDRGRREEAAGDDQADRKPARCALCFLIINGTVLRASQMTPAGFWAMHAAIAAGGGLLVMLFGRPLSRALYPTPS